MATATTPRSSAGTTTSGVHVPARRPDGQAAVIFSQARLLVDDFAAAFRFYRTRSGCERVRRRVERLRLFDTGSAAVAIFGPAGRARSSSCARPATRRCSCSRWTTSTPSGGACGAASCARPSTSPNGAARRVPARSRREPGRALRAAATPGMRLPRSFATRTSRQDRPRASRPERPARERAGRRRHAHPRRAADARAAAGTGHPTRPSAPTSAGRRKDPAFRIEPVLGRCVAAAG